MRLKKAEREFVAYQRVCRVATVSRDGRPHNVPVCPILEGDRVYFGSASDGVKVRNVRRPVRWRWPTTSTRRRGRASGES